MSLVRLLLYSNEFDIEGPDPDYLNLAKGRGHPETMRTLIRAYGEVRPNLLLHAQGWPEADYLDQRVIPGSPPTAWPPPARANPPTERRPSLPPSTKTTRVPSGSASGAAPTLWPRRSSMCRTTRRRPSSTSSSASCASTPSPTRTTPAPGFAASFPTSSISSSPPRPTGGEYYYATWTGISGDAYYRNGAGADFTTVTNEWLDTNIRSKGPLGKLYPRFMFIMEGDTPSLSRPHRQRPQCLARPDWGGWGGRYIYRQPYGETHPIWTQGGDEFLRVTSQDTVTGVDGAEHISDQATIWRWRDAFQNDFAARMDWTIEDFAHANHNPVIVVTDQAGKDQSGNDHTGTAPIYIDAEVGKPVTLDATKSSDPDAGQKLHYNWFHYFEAGGTGTNLSEVTITGTGTAKATVTATAVCREPWLPGFIKCTGNGTAHIILAVTDDGSPRLTSYRRIVLTVHPASAQ